ncbi:undecaprenyldiphospho-muramoylpentapeptide beta-N-acetylglucosaminyltransferase [Flavilitoribacter nigricans]|uniref:UDP-N-acetylglucosamine--N-acetylmuramyl-(pentapeptide) pyrophosphoryl-undecaprenol N-acetylglucosamine transferase n=1 Tax=Flavilitoribacter nigricans (strain ATCC 23147 / DSM 23189 / NBRC 102662 / NCIMB 1420 / SS-2) TaxID=1122177 RepID=A0A2D0N9M1_FLAN2|nr:undecaprenyldiphospho-muramoylpentapeptide beta-N-acetylglucosaminyltransferase [Flavilitoribacter nigricans]PHN05221.1 undecaprenyldiphospho-muramoylpentapeptide beta-N-acetylglucosaminyltransferase [Flavilitoribacter nigricans DSM 23189 = NBRC 102662]
MANRIIISGGGTGGHTFPAIAIADAIKEKEPETEILFVGAKGKMEMEKVPKAGYPIKGLWISGFHRKLTLRNLMFPLKLLTSMLKAWSIIRDFRPDAAVGVGGFASGPVLDVASRMGIPALIQEQNSYAGATNRILSGKVNRICVAYDHMERYFPADKLVLTGNPVRKDMLREQPSREEGAAHFGFNPNQPILFIFGGSLGAKSINEAMAANSAILADKPEIQVLWQMGSLYVEDFGDCATAQLENVRAEAFIDRMDMAYAMADLVICRAGALTISELAQLGQPAMLIPSPNVAEDHQTKNAMALVEKNAGVLLPDPEAKERIITRAMSLLAQPETLEQLGKNIRTMARPDAAARIAAEVLQLIEKKGGR